MTGAVQCEACGKSMEPTSADGAALCAECREKAGLPEPLPSRRPALPCARCGHLEIVRVTVRERTVVPGIQSNVERVAPAALTFGRGEAYKGFFSSKKVPTATADSEKPYGLLDAHVCRACGFTELYAQEPETIPVGAIFGTQLIVAEPPKK